MKKEKIIKWFISLLCTTLLILGSCITVCAKESISVAGETFNYTYNVSQLVDIIKSQRNVDVSGLNPKYQVLMYNWSTNPLSIKAYISIKPFYKNIDSEGYQQLCTDGLCGEVSFTVENGVITPIASAGMIHAEHRNLISRDGDLQKIIYYTNYDIVDKEDNSIFFQRPLQLVELAIPLTGAVQEQTEIILPIVAGCLALLVGLTILAKKLRIFL